LTLAGPQCKTIPFCQKGLALLANPFFLSEPVKPLTAPYQVALLAAVVLTVFYPSLFAEISLVDDLQAITAVFNDDNMSLHSIFFPRSAGGGYYRPFIGVSYWIDKEWFGLEGRLMHFELVIAHLLNGLLVFACMKKLSVLCLKQPGGLLPIIAGLLFATHPLTTESVNWISGRTDVMMANFLLFSFLLLLQYKQTSRRVWFWLSAITATGGLLAKEAAFGYLLTLPLLFTIPFNDARMFGANTKTSKSNVIWFSVFYISAFLVALFLDLFWLVLVMAITCGFVILRQSKSTNSSLMKYKLLTAIASFGFVVLSFFVVRRLAFSTDVDKIGNTIKLMFADINYTISLFLGAVGFYVKKFLVPIPLNFFIIEVDPLYDFVGILVLFVVIVLLVRKNVADILVLIGFCLLLPALPFAFGTIAWTAYAERYIYLSSAFWVMAICLYAARWYGGNPTRLRSFVPLILLSLLVVEAGITFRRNIVWQKNVTLLEDTVNQNPRNRMLRDIYMAALLDAGDIENAMTQYRIALKLPPSLYKNRYDDRADLLIGQQLQKEQRFDEALRVYEQALIKTKYGSEGLLEATIDLLATMPEPNDEIEMGRRSSLLQDLRVKLALMSNKPARLLQLGKIFMAQGAFDAAGDASRRALSNIKSDSNLRVPLEQLCRDVSARKR